MGHGNAQPAPGGEDQVCTVEKVGEYPSQHLPALAECQRALHLFCASPAADLASGIEELPPTARSILAAIPLGVADADPGERWVINDELEKRLWHHLRGSESLGLGPSDALSVGLAISAPSAPAEPCLAGGGAPSPLGGGAG